MDADIPERCLVCGGPLRVPRRSLGSAWGGESIEGDGREVCANGCTETVEYTQAKERWRAERGS
ncbi:MAG TPA: hypothetical protein VFJ94_10730 [Intrasporangium sp.]|uniref:hypothetical protein n=1 Tax=Intrasporangium sp. TaxID=1925024 RepID=UPI002D767A02|nr:hypothetical protein [Intrasporangium sp.]HET7398985.1 hypothetical protein [Intrasporangium sp.]